MNIQDYFQFLIWLSSTQVNNSHKLTTIVSESCVSKVLRDPELHFHKYCLSSSILDVGRGPTPASYKYGISCKFLQSIFAEAAFKDVLKIAFVTQYVNSRYEMYCKKGVLLI